MTVETALELRSTLRSLKRQDALSGHTKLAYAADKTLSALDGELEEYEQHRRRILSEHSERSEKGRRLMTAGGDTIAVEEDEDHQITAIYEPGTDTELTREDVSGQLEHNLSNAAAAQEEIQALQTEEANADLHEVETGIFFEHADLDGAHARVDLSALDPWLTDGEKQAA